MREREREREREGLERYRHEINLSADHELKLKCHAVLDWQLTHKLGMKGQPLPSKEFHIIVINNNNWYKSDVKKIQIILEYDNT